MAKEKYQPAVLIDEHARPLIVFTRGRTKYHAVKADETSITLVALDTLRGYRELQRNGAAYPVKRCASRWLNHDWRPITSRARAVLKGLVARK